MFFGKVFAPLLVSAALSLVVCRSTAHADCNGNTVSDSEDVETGTSLDCNDNLVPDECEQSLLKFGQIEAALPLPFSTAQIAAADLEGDGDLDLVALGAATGAPLAVVLNAAKRDGKDAGGFSDAAVYEALDDLEEFRLADLDGDGHIDVAARSRDTLWIYRSDGEGRLLAPTGSALPERVEGFSTADLNGDGAVDLAMLFKRSDDPVAIFDGRGDGTFQSPRLFPLSPGGDVPRAIVCADMDGDGDIDIATANERSENVSVLLGDGAGNFPDLVTVPLAGKAVDLAVADLDGNGALDLVVASDSRNDPLRILLGAAGGVSFDQASFHLRASRVSSADADGDGDVDILAWMSSTDLLSVLLNDGAGRFPAKTDIGFGIPLRDLAVGDFDRDGDVDVAAAAGTRIQGLPVYWNDEGESLAVETRTFPLMNSRPPHTAALADLDGDGDLDCVTGDGPNSTLSILIGDGHGNYAVKNEIAVGKRVNSVTTGDFNDDGDTDLAICGSNLARIYLNRGDAVFEAYPDLFPGFSSVHVIATDLNGDGGLDVVIANHAGRNISVYLHQRDGPELIDRQGVMIDAGNGPNSIAPGDFDGDGDIDLAVANGFASTVTLLSNAGDATFGDPVELAAKNVPSWLVSGDWNRDGHVDLAAANEGQGTVGVLLNRGDGTFGEVAVVGVDYDAYSLQPADFNGDGHLDLITANANDDNVSVLLNGGSGTFVTFGHYRTETEPRFAPVGDVDGDGDIDIVAANRRGLSVTVLLNQLTSRVTEDYTERICTPLDFERLAVRSTGGASGIKYTVPARDDPALLPAVFQNSRRFALHHEFLRAAFPDRFPGLTATALIGLTQLRASRDYYIGSVEKIEDPETLYVYSVVTSAARDELLTLEEVRGVHETLSAAFALRPLAYAPDLTGQNPFAREAARAWANPGFDIYLDTVDPPSDYIPYTQAVGYGRVRLFSGEDFEEANRTGRFTFQDIAVVSIAPRDIEGVVGGIITGAPQGALSHVSIRTARRGTPNAYVSRAMDVFARLEGRLVRLEVRVGEYLVEEATREEAEAFWARRPKLSEPRPFDADYRSLDPFHDMDVALDASVPAESRYGGKATGLARLQTILEGPYARYQERGYAIPVAYYLDFMLGNTISSVRDPGREVTYQAYLEELFALPEFQTDSEFRFEALDRFRDHAREFGRLPQGLAEQISRRTEEVFGSPEVMVRFRSSSNVEDILQFNGAGLYESTSVCLADSLDDGTAGPSLCDPARENERTIERALRKVWTSLWTFRAHEERSFFQIPQLSAAMGLLVNRAFRDEVANGVAFTGDPTRPRGGCYLVTVQAGEESVVSPDPGVLPEVNVLEIADGEVLGIVRALPSTLVEPGTFILSDEKLRELGRLMWHIDENYPLDTDGHPREDILLDLEFKIEPDDSLAIKQVRPFLTAGEKSSRPTFRLEIPPGTALCGRQNLISPSGDPRGEYERKSVVRLRGGVVELFSSHCLFSADLIEEVRFGPDQEQAVPEGPGIFRVEERTESTGARTFFTFSYRQLFSLSGGRQLEIDLVQLEFATVAGRPARERVVFDEGFIAEHMRMFGFVGNETITYASCTNELLSLWDIDAEFDDGTLVRLRERFEPAENFLLTGPAGIEAVELLIGGERYFVSDYWKLVYSSARHNTSVKYWILLDPPATVPGIDGAVHALQFAPADSPEVVDIVDVPQVESAAYLDRNFEVLARPGVTSFEKRRARRSSKTPFRRADTNVDGSINVADALHVLDYLFRRGEPFECEKAADANDDGRVDMNDGLLILLHLFRGASLPPPDLLCGTDRTFDRLECESFSGCF